MPSFEIADCPTKLPLTEKAEAGGRVQTGALTLTVRNQTQRARTARITIELEGAAKPAWFVFDGASPTNAREIERDFDPKGNATIRVNISVPLGEAPGTHVFRVRATAEDDPDNDFTVGPNVAVDVVSWAVAPPPPPSKFPWWAIAIAAVLVLAVGGAVIYLIVRPAGPVVPPLIGQLWDEAAQKKLSDANVPYDPPILVPSSQPGALANKIIGLDPEANTVLPSGVNLKIYIVVQQGGGDGRPPFCRIHRCDLRNWTDLNSSVREAIGSRFPDIVRSLTGNPQ
jgi:hypothetical protein